MTTEKYYAVRIGTPGRHQPYFKMREGTLLPQLYHTRAMAQADASKGARVVKVTLHDGKCC